jgi:hypothetical protein
MDQTHYSSLGEAIPKAPLRAVDLSQRMAASLLMCGSVTALTIFYRVMRMRVG